MEGAPCPSNPCLYSPPETGQARISARRQDAPPWSQVWGSRRMKRATCGSGRRFSTGVSGSELAGNTWGHQVLCKGGLNPSSQPGGGPREGAQAAELNEKSTPVGSAGDLPTVSNTDRCPQPLPAGSPRQPHFPFWSQLIRPIWPCDSGAANPRGGQDPTL